MNRHIFHRNAQGSSFALARLLVLAVVVSFLGCSGSSEPKQDGGVEREGKPTVVVTNSVVENVVQKLCEDRVSIVRIFSKDDSANWRPGADDVAKLQAADLILLSGANYEPWAAQLSLPRSRLVNTSDDYKDQLVVVGDSVAHQHGPNGRETGTDVAWATWLDPELAVLQVRAIEDAVCKLLPDASKLIVQRSNALSAELEELDQRIETLAANTEGLVVVGDLMTQGYLVRRLNWTLTPVVSGDRPADSDIDLILYSETDRGSVGEITTVRVQLCHRLEDSEDSLRCMEMNLDRLEKAVQLLSP